MLQMYILRIAATYNNVPEIYFPIHLDNRGILYPKPTHLNYQSSELAKSLLLFSKPGYVNREDKTSIDYLFAYGATCYGNGLQKFEPNDLNKAMMLDLTLLDKKTENKIIELYKK